VLVLPLYPQYAAATTASVNDAVMPPGQLRPAPQPELRFVNQYHDDPGYIARAGPALRSALAKHGRGEKLVLSFHGVPERSLLLGDPYHCQCHKTARLLAEALGLAPDDLARHLPEPLRQGQVAGTLYRAHVA
jgi:ferrochelatase